MRQVYAGQKQYGTVKSLREATVAGWNDILQETLVKLSFSMQSRCVNVLQCHGRKIKC